MNNFEHRKLIESISKIDTPPDDPAQFAEWIKAGAHLGFLRENATADEVAIYASGDYTFLHSVVVPNRRLSPLLQGPASSGRPLALESQSVQFPRKLRIGQRTQRRVAGTGSARNGHKNS